MVSGFVGFIFFGLTSISFFITLASLCIISMWLENKFTKNYTKYFDEFEKGTRMSKILWFFYSFCLLLLSVLSFIWMAVYIIPFLRTCIK